MINVTPFYVAKERDGSYLQYGMIGLLNLHVKYKSRAQYHSIAPYMQNEHEAVSSRMICDRMGADCLAFGEQFHPGKAQPFSGLICRKKCSVEKR